MPPVNPLPPQFRQGEGFGELPLDELSRRRFLAIMGASLALAGMSSCMRMPPEKIIPYVVPPEDFVPGHPLFFASASELGGYARGILVESHEGRPTKIEGNPKHSASLGASDVFMQADLLTLYDPARSKSPLFAGEPASWEAWLGQLAELRAKWRKSAGAGVRILTGRITSPTQQRLLAAFLRLYPEARAYAFEAVHAENERLGLTRAFGARLQSIYHLESARVIVSFDDAFLDPGPAQLAYARAFAQCRSYQERDLGALPWNRLYCAESGPTLTGAMADHRIALKPSEIAPLLWELNAALTAQAAPPSTNVAANIVANGSSARANWLARAVADLKANQGKALVTVGSTMPAEAHALAAAINDQLQARGRTIDYIDSSGFDLSDPLASLEALCKEMEEGKLSTLFVLGSGVNPAYAAPSSLRARFLSALPQVPLRVRLAHYEDETSFHCHWHLPEAHFLEAWGDARAWDGTVALQQPLIEPLYEGRSLAQALSSMMGEDGRSGKELLLQTWKNELNFEQLLQEGVIARSQAPYSRLALRNSPPPPAPQPASGFELQLRADPLVWDGRYATNAWAQELPKPITQLCWDNALYLGPATASAMNVSTEDEVEITTACGRKLAAVLVLPNHAEGSGTLFLGHGRTRAGAVGEGVGTDAYALLGLETAGYTQMSLRKTGARRELAVTQMHHQMDEREPILHGEWPKAARAPGKLVSDDKRTHNQPSVVAAFPEGAEAWAMVIDLNVCIGCKACMIACQAENNTPVVGKDQVRRSREMHWIRVDSYFQATSLSDHASDEARVFFQPVPCMQCERAPCEEVCPTAATNHSHDGLNQMVYNRCVGTRYCSNNCPYKVRRFNFFQYSDFKSPTLRMMMNPEVTVRSRGVMEKCTYCVQRIQSARIEAEKQQREIRDGEITPACAQACPTEAIVFGNQADPSSRVAKLKRLPLEYSLLNELGTRPRTTYLAKLTSPHEGGGVHG